VALVLALAQTVTRKWRGLPPPTTAEAAAAEPPQPATKQTRRKQRRVVRRHQPIQAHLRWTTATAAATNVNSMGVITATIKIAVTTSGITLVK
jgi:hypothetical protein